MISAEFEKTENTAASVPHAKKRRRRAAGNNYGRRKKQSGRIAHRDNPAQAGLSETRRRP